MPEIRRFRPKTSRGLNRDCRFFFGDAYRVNRLIEGLALRKIETDCVRGKLLLMAERKRRGLALDVGNRGKRHLDPVRSGRCQYGTRAGRGRNDVGGGEDL